MRLYRTFKSKVSATQFAYIHPFIRQRVLDIDIIVSVLLFNNLTLLELSIVLWTSQMYAINVLFNDLFSCKLNTAKFTNPFLSSLLFSLLRILIRLYLFIFLNYLIPMFIFDVLYGLYVIFSNELICRRLRAAGVTKLLE